MSRKKGKQNTPQNIINEMMRIYKEDGVTVRGFSSIYKMPFKSVKNMVPR